jgi:hypothetical protein
VKKKHQGIPQRPNALCSPGHLAEPCYFLVNARFTQKGTSIYSDFERSRERTEKPRPAGRSVLSYYPGPSPPERQRDDKQREEQRQPETDFGGRASAIRRYGDTREACIRWRGPSDRSARRKLPRGSCPSGLAGTWRATRALRGLRSRGVRSLYSYQSRAKPRGSPASRSVTVMSSRGVPRGDVTCQEKWPDQTRERAPRRSCTRFRAI